MKPIATDYPTFIKKFPIARMPDGSPGPRFLDADDGQVAFHTISVGKGVPMHSHDDSWAVLVSGAMTVTVGENTFEARAGEAWYIPAGVAHGGKATEKSLLVEVFCEERFRTD